MRPIFVAVALALALVATPAHAAPLKDGQQKNGLLRLVSKPVVGIRKGVQRFKTNWADPQKRRRMIGKAAVTVMTIGVGEVINLGLRHQGMPPMPAAFLAGSVPTYASHYVEKGLSKVAPRYFEAPKDKTQKELLFRSAFAGTVGTVATVGLDKLGDVMDKALRSDQAAAFGRVGAKATVGLGKRFLNAFKFGTRKVGDQAVTVAGDKAHDKASQKLFGARHIEIATAE